MLVLVLVLDPRLPRQPTSQGAGPPARAQGARQTACRTIRRAGQTAIAGKSERRTESPACARRGALRCSWPLSERDGLWKVRSRCFGSSRAASGPHLFLVFISRGPSEFPLQAGDAPAQSPPARRANPAAARRATFRTPSWEGDGPAGVPHSGRACAVRDLPEVRKPPGGFGWGRAPRQRGRLRPPIGPAPRAGAGRCVAPVGQVRRVRQVRRLRRARGRYPVRGHYAQERRAICSASI